MALLLLTTSLQNNIIEDLIKKYFTVVSHCYPDIFNIMLSAGDVQNKLMVFAQMQIFCNYQTKMIIHTFIHGRP